MNPGALTLGALGVAVLVSCVSRINVGLLAMALAWLIGVYVAGFPVKTVAAGFPVELFLTLTGVTLLFAQAGGNGTLQRVAQNAVRLCRGRAGMVPILFFLLAAMLGTCGPGNIATTGLLAPVAMSTALRMRISPFLMAIMVGNGANASSLSPLAPTGLIVSGLMEKIGLPGMELKTWWLNLAAHALVAFAGYVLFGGVRLLREPAQGGVEVERAPLKRSHWITLAVIVALVGGVVFGRVQIGMAAFGCAVVLSLLRAADEDEAIQRVPWGTIVMVCGVTVLISLLEKTSGLELFTGLVARVATSATVIPLVAFLVGLISAYSSTSGVVLPAFLPLVPGLVAKLGLASGLGLAETMNVAGHLVDVSPLSTIGALCIASIPAGDASRLLFNQLLAWGLSMTVVGAVLCWAVLG
ncbi:MAG: C4-dicarboxylate ABC transporter [Acidobacteria bacterium]|nr:C4-dicarboxylate ABC transporter [Acidobacteriota bacterium]